MENDFLSEYSEKEYGSGDEISSTGFLVFGILTYWIYTVLQYYKLFSIHVSNRLKYFEQSINFESLEDETKKPLLEIMNNGFHISKSPRNICITLYLISLVFLVLVFIAQILVADLYISMEFFDKFAKVSITFSAFLFCIATLYYLIFIIRSFKKHEYNELLIYRYLVEPENFKILPPSKIFKKRWEKNFNFVAFFLVLSFPITLSPIFATAHIYSLIESGSDYVKYIVIWTITMFSFAAIFHLWGTKLLIDMYNGHLRIESLNRSNLTSNDKWKPDTTQSVVKDDSKINTENAAIELVPKRALAAIMLTDMFGFSKDMERSEGVTYEKLLKHNEIIRSQIASNNGKEIKTIGDAFLVKFSSAVDAVGAAINIQKKFSEYNETVEEDRKIKVRIGIHIGDVLIMGEDVIGNGVNIAARIEPLAEVGGICISSDVYNIIKKSIDIKVVNLGKKELKNIQDAPEIYRIILESINQ